MLTLQHSILILDVQKIAIWTAAQDMNRDHSHALRHGMTFARQHGTGLEPLVAASSVRAQFPQRSLTQQQFELRLHKLTSSQQSS